MPYCPKCGREVSENANFCRRCGSNLKVEEEVTRTVPAKRKRTSGKGLHKTSWLEKHPNTVTILWAILCIMPLTSLFACYSVLNEKSRSSAWLLLLFVPPCFIGAWIILMLQPSSLLTKEQVRAGLWIEREGVFLNLKKGEEFLTTFPSDMTTKATIRQEAQKYV